MRTHRQPALAIGLFTAALIFGLPASTGAQCLLGNPSFEVPGSGGAVFGAWNQFGDFGSSPTGTHGATAARVSGPNTGNWDVSAYWQRLDTQPGDQWAATACVWHTATNPLTGSSTAILNIEWRDAGGNLIDFESHTLADAATPIDEVQLASIVSQPAPAGAVATHILVGVLHAPGDPVPDVYYDSITFDELGPPTVEELQWDDFPGGRTISFAGRSWRVKGPGFYGPGPNTFDDSPLATWVDGAGLHMTVRNDGGIWKSTEVVLEEALSYGDYVFTTVGELDLLDPNVILGLFIWQYARCFDPANNWWQPYNEIDVEFSRWGDPGNDVGQFVAQPFDWPGNIDRFDVTFAPGERASHAFRWLPDRVEFRSWRGGPNDESAANMIHEWTYTGFHIPRPEMPRVHINLWWINPPAADQEVVLEDFTFTPGCTGVHCDEIVDVAEVARPGLELVAAPNPFSTETQIRFDAAATGEAALAIFDPSGRLVREIDGAVSRGANAFAWDRTDAGGHRVAPGVYFYRLDVNGAMRAGRVVVTR